MPDGLTARSGYVRASARRRRLVTPAAIRDAEEQYAIALIGPVRDQQAPKHRGFTKADFTIDGPHMRPPPAVSYFGGAARMAPHIPLNGGAVQACQRPDVGNG
jgi:hypothetical protein